MTERRILIIGNSGSGKTTMARELVAAHGLAHLDLDSVAWDDAGERLPLAQSAAAIQAFDRAHRSWVIEGSYASLIAVALPCCTELRLLNPGVDVCVENCQRRPWEPQKYASKADQDARLPFLLDWVRQYETRTDEYGLAQHQALFDGFSGAKRMFGPA